MNRLKTNRNLANRRPRCFLGAVASIASSIIGSNAQRLERRRQERAQDYTNMLEEAKSDSTAMNSILDYTKNYLSQFNTVARLGTSKKSKLNNNIFITDGGDAVKIDKDTFLLRGGSHEQVNETGQTGIGINVGGNEIEAEGGEVAQKKNGALRIFSAQPILGNGMSPAQAILRGYNKDKVFSQQQAFKKRNGIKDDGSKAAFGNLITMPFAGIVKDVVDYFSNSGKYAPKRVEISNKTVTKKPIRNSQVGNVRVVNGKYFPNEKPLRRVYPEFDIISMGRGLPVGKAAKATVKAAKNEVSHINRISKSRLYSDNPIVNTYARRYNLPDKAYVTGQLPYNLFYDPTYAESDYVFPKRFGGRCKLRNGGLTSKDRGSSKHPYPSVSSKDFAGGGRSYPIPTKADAIDALRLAGLHGRSDVRSKVFSKYPSLRPKSRNGGSWKAPVYNTNRYRVSNRMRRQIATWEGSDFAGQNRKFNGDAIGAKERELRQIMGKTYNYLTDNQRDSLNSIYYNSRVDTFKNKFGKWFRTLNDAVDRGDERAFNNSLAGIRQSMTIGENRKGMSGLAKRRAWERNWFGNPIPMDSNETKAILKQQAEARMVQPTDNTRVIIQPEYIEVPAPVGHGVVPVDNPDPNLLQGSIKDNLINMGNKFRLGQKCGGSTRMRKALGCESRPVKGMRVKARLGLTTNKYTNSFIPMYTTDRLGNYSITKGQHSFAKVNTTPGPIPLFNKIQIPNHASTPDYGGSNKSGMILRDADWYSLGADLIGAIGAGIIGAKAAGNTYIPEAPVRYQATKLNTNYNITPQLETIRRSRNRLANEVAGNTSSSVAAINRLNLLENNANEQLNKLYDIKENRESELLNQDALNQQSVSAQNVQAINDYNYRVAELKNARNQAMGNVLTGTLQGIGNSFQNFISQSRQNYDDTQAMLMGVAASDYATPSRLLELGVDVGDDAALAGIYHSAMNIPNPGARPKREDYSDNTEYSYALNRWENQNKAYQRRNSYADLIKGRISKKNLIKYGIV